MSADGEMMRRAADIARTRGECADCGVAGNDLCDSCDGTGRRSGGLCHACLPVGSGTVECPTCLGTGTNTEEPDALIHLAVADALDAFALTVDRFGDVGELGELVAIARTYLGEQS